MRSLGGPLPFFFSQSMFPFAFVDSVLTPRFRPLAPVFLSSHPQMISPLLRPAEFSLRLFGFPCSLSAFSSSAPLHASLRLHIVFVQAGSVCFQPSGSLYFLGSARIRRRLRSLGPVWDTAFRGLGSSALNHVSDGPLYFRIFLVRQDDPLGRTGTQPSGVWGVASSTM